MVVAVPADEAPVLIDPAALVPCELSRTMRRRWMGRAVATATFGLHGASVAVHFDDPAAAQAFAARYDDLRTDAAPSSDVYAIGEAGRRALLFARDGPAYLWPHAALGSGALAFLADVVATHALFGRIPNAIALHAAALAHRGAAFAFVGASEAGKSTTALACAATSSCGLYSDERCVVVGGRVVPYPRALSIRSGTLALFARELPETSPLRLRLAAHGAQDWRDARFREVLGEGAEAPAALPLGAIFAIVGRGESPSTRRVAPAAILGRAVHGAKLPQPGLAGVGALLGVLQRAACYELVLGSPLATARHVVERLEEPAA